VLVRLEAVEPVRLAGLGQGLLQGPPDLWPLQKDWPQGPSQRLEVPLLLAQVRLVLPVQAWWARLVRM
jgi:hypothetical protein